MAPSGVDDSEYMDNNPTNKQFPGNTFSPPKTPAADAVARTSVAARRVLQVPRAAIHAVLLSTRVAPERVVYGFCDAAVAGRLSRRVILRQAPASAVSFQRESNVAQHQPKARAQPHARAHGAQRQPKTRPSVQEQEESKRVGNSLFVFRQVFTRKKSKNPVYRKSLLTRLLRSHLNSTERRSRTVCIVTVNVSHHSQRLSSCLHLQKC